MPARPRKSATFSHSSCFHAWQAVLQSETLLAAVREHGYTILFAPHPAIRQGHDFRLDGVSLSPDSPSAGDRIEDLFADTALFITDYSSLAADVAFIGRSVLYFQFDRDALRTRSREHVHAQGCFDYEREGFGDVALTVDDLCARAEALMRRSCRVDERYAARADAFFTFRDQNNCQRVYDAICRLSGPWLP
jgi:CDP-glycerol glycerophosphotransferase (TagB/SpsB family)